MMEVVDTNVAVVANGHSPQVSSECVLVCVQRLRRITNEDDKLVLDDGWRIIREYLDHLQPAGQPGVGDAFLKWVLTNWANPQRCELVTITPVNHSDTDFREFPSDAELEGFDRSDRKFVAVAAAHPQRPPILQAADSKWLDFKDALRRNGVIVEFICEGDIQRLHVRKRKRKEIERRKT
jgi:hypothetical protein